MADGVEVAFLDGLVVVRHSREPHRAVLVFTPDEWATFTAGVREGDFDYETLMARSAGDGSGVMPSVQGGKSRHIEAGV